MSPSAFPEAYWNQDRAEKVFDLRVNSKVYNPLMRLGLFIGELTHEAGVDAWTIRYYEKERLIPAAPRSATHYRIYPKDTVDLIRFIKTAQGLGLTLEEIKKVFSSAKVKQLSQFGQEVRGFPMLKKVAGILY